jgi:dTDP-4-amino-4,6-dideoxygalactose transaminase
MHFPVSWGGNPIDPDVYRIGKEYGIPILEDAACSTGAMIALARSGHWRTSHASVFTPGRS